MLFPRILRQETIDVGGVAVCKLDFSTVKRMKNWNQTKMKKSLTKWMEEEEKEEEEEEEEEKG